jgi:RNA polymerase sigma-70 factor (ECF subfamily)
MAKVLDERIAGYGPALGRIAASYERNPSLRDELLQETYLAIVAALPRLRDPDKLRAYIFRIAHNCGVRHIIGRTRETRGSIDPDNLPSEAPTQEQSVIAGERAAALVAAVRRLALPYRQVITLVLEDLTHAEIAEALGISETNVAVRVNRAKQQLRSWLHPHG